MDPKDSSKRSTVLASIVSYRTAELVARCLESLVEEHARAQEAGIDLSVLVIDNDSGDAAPLEQAIQRLGIGAWARVERAERNGGFAYGNNLAMQRAYESGNAPDYFWLLNPDTEVRPNAVRALIAFLSVHRDAGIAGSGLETETGALWPYAFRFPTLLSELDAGLNLGLISRLLEESVVLRKMNEFPEKVDWLPGASMMVKRAMIDAIGGMDESYFLYYEETDYCLRACEAGWSVWYVPESRVMHAAGGSTGVTTARERPRRFPGYWYDSRRRYFQKNFGIPYAAVTDVVFAGAAMLGNLKRLVLGRYSTTVPHQIRDVLSHSALFQTNRAIDEVKRYHPTGRE